MIWKQTSPSLESLNAYNQSNMAEHLGIRFIAVGADFLEAEMPVDNRTIQPYGLLHGGASCALAETLGSIASAMVVDLSQFRCVGLEINANHIRSAKTGFVRGRAKPLHLGRSTHVWDIRIENENQELICISRLTVAVIPVAP